MAEITLRPRPHPSPNEPPALRCVVVADDNEEQRWLLHQMLQPMGYEVVEASDGRDLFWAIWNCRRRFSATDVLVIADVRMPIYNGLDVLEAWHGDWRFPFVVITAFPDPRVAERVKSFGGILLAKPFTLFDLRTVVRRCLHGGL